MACYTTTSTAPLVQKNCISGKCETRISEQFVNHVPAAMIMVSDQSTVLGVQTTFYNVIKDMRSSKYNAQKSAISSVYAAHISESFLAPADVTARENVVNQFVCWVKKSNIYEGECVGFLETVTNAVNSVLVGGDGGFDESTAHLLIENFNKTVSMASKVTCCDTNVLVLKNPFVV